MGDLVGAAEAVMLLQDEDLRSRIINEILADPDALSDLAGDFADELSDLLEDDPLFKKQLLRAALGTAEFKTKIAKELAGELSD